MAINYPDGGGNNPYVPDFQNVNVVPADLAQFADLLDDDVQAIKDTWERLRGDMLSQPEPNFSGEHLGEFSYATGQPVHGSSSGMYEAREFNRAYRKTLSAEWSLMEDLIKGLEALRDAARTIHDGYVASDTTNADHLAGAFTTYERSAVLEALGQPEPAAEGESTTE